MSVLSVRMNIRFCVIVGVVGFILLNNASLSLAHSNFPPHKTKPGSGTSPGILQKPPNVKQASRLQSDLNSVYQQQDLTSGLVCISCENRNDCRKTLTLIVQDASNPNIPTETCSNPGDQCVLHFSTTLDIHEDKNDSETISGHGEMSLIRAGCEFPDPNADLGDGNCMSTRVERQYKDGKFIGTHGTRTCYCDTHKCNTNSELKCYYCLTNCATEPPELKSFNSFNARTCYASPTGAGIDFFRNNEDDYNAEQRLTRPVPCEMKVNAEDWEDNYGNIFKRECTCSTNGCNKIIYELAAYFSKKPTTCYSCGGPGPLSSCEKQNTGSTPVRHCRRREACSMQSVKDSSGDFIPTKYGCQEPSEREDGTRMRTGCALTDGNRIRTCYCDEDYCNSWNFPCYYCSDQRCRNPYKSSEQCERGAYGQARTRECYITYDNTGYPAKLVAGCRDSTITEDGEGMDPDCYGDLTSTWIESKGQKSCRCETDHCNSMLGELAPDYPTRPPEPEPTVKPDDTDLEELTESSPIVKCFTGDCDKGGCQRDDNDLETTTCVGGCLYSRKKIIDENGDQEFIRSRGCTTDTNIDMSDEECVKVNEALAHCVCHMDQCNHPKHDSKFDKKINKLKDKDTDHQGTKNEASSSTLDTRIWALFVIGAWHIF